MTSITLSEDKMRSILLQFYQEGYNQCVNQNSLDSKGKIELGRKVRSVGNKSYFAILENGVMTYGNCPHVDSDIIDRWSVTNKQAIQLMISEINHMVQSANDSVNAGFEDNKTEAEKQRQKSINDASFEMSKALDKIIDSNKS